MKYKIILILLVLSSLVISGCSNNTKRYYAFTEECKSCSSLNECQPACDAKCVGRNWLGSENSTGYEHSEYIVGGIEMGRKIIECTCRCYNYE